MQEHDIMTLESHKNQTTQQDTFCRPRKPPGTT